MAIIYIARKASEVFKYESEARLAKNPENIVIG
jgi:hypothetical protein